MSNTTHFTMEGDLVLKVQNALSGIDQLQQKLTKLKLPKENESELTGNYKKLQQEAQNYINIIQKGFKTKQDTKELDASFNKIKKYINEYSNAFRNIDTSTLKKAFDDINGSKIAEKNQELENLKKNFSSLGEEASKNIKQSLGNIKNEVQGALNQIDLGDKAKDIAKEIDNAFKNTGGTIAKNFGEGKFDLIENNLKRLKERLVNVFSTSGMDSGKSTEFLNQIDQAIKRIDPNPIEDLKQKIAEMQQEIEKLKADNLKQAGDFAKEGGAAAESARQGFGQLQDGIRGAANEQVRLNSELDHLKSRIQYFFGLTNGVMLFRRALKQAVQTTKELDEVMTQTAVVSKNTVGDMWAKLPEYSKEAMKLGASIKDVYAAQTLYVQQGLEMDQAMKLGIETLKMARVAGLDAATATDTMTAALRGFKMELNETSVQNINDVYSKLAQNTASNVQEISTAMSKVAALANSANMSFEGTAAYLAKIIESTREGAETAGTALKTVLARFTEVKKLYSEGELTGTDEEGQEVDVNKISKALRTAGIEMNSFFTGAKSMEDVLNELGEKWDSLTVVQQRYIATMAAGSRQQSRFLALMQDWGRTTELVNMANNAEGSGQEQFEKTLDSLAVKITNLKNAWNTFIMGLANNSIIKGVVDTIKTIIEGINKAIDVISGGNGIIKSLASLGAAFAVFKIGKMLFNGFLGNIGQTMGLKGAQAGQQFGQNFSNKANQQTESFKNKLKARFGQPIEVQVQVVSKGNIANFNSDLLGGLSQDKQAQFQGAFDQFAALDASKMSAEEYAAALDRLKTSYIEAGGSGEQFNAAVTKNSTAMKMTSTSTKSLSTALNSMSMGITIAAGAMMTLSSVLDDGTEEGEKAANACKIVGLALLTLPPIIKIVSLAVKLASHQISASVAAIPIIGWIAAAVAAIITLISFIHKLASEDPETKFWEKYEEACKKAVDGAKQAYDEYKNTIDSIKDISAKEAKLDELTYGTEQWNTAVEELNQSILELIATYPELANAVQWVNDHMVLNLQSKEYRDWVKKQQEKAYDAQLIMNTTEYAKAYKKAYDATLVSNIRLGENYTLQVGYENGKLNFNNTIKDNGTYYSSGKYVATSQSNVAQLSGTSPFYINENYTKFWLADLLGGELALLTDQESNREISYQDENGNWQTINFKEFQQHELAKTGFKNVVDANNNPIDNTAGAAWFLNQFYGDLAGPLQEAIESGKVTGMGGALPFITDFIRNEWNPTITLDNGTIMSLDEYGAEYEQQQQLYDREVLAQYFTDLWTKNGKLDTDIPLQKLFETYSPAIIAQENLVNSTYGLRLGKVEELGVRNEDKQVYLKYGENRFKNIYDSYGTDENFQRAVDEYINIERNKLNYIDMIGITSEDWNEGYKTAFELYARARVAMDKLYSGEEFDKFNTWYTGLGESKNIARSIISGQTDKLKISEIGLLNNELVNVEKYTGIDFDLEEFQSNYNKIYEGIKKEFKDKIETMLQDFTISEAKQVTGGLRRVIAANYDADNLTEIEDSYLEEIEEIYRIIGKQDKNTRADAEAILQRIDWTNKDSIDRAKKELKDLGINIDDFADNIALMTKAVREFNEEKIKEEIEAIQKSKNLGQKLQEGTKTFSTEDINALEKIGVFDENDWVQTGLDEWVYIGEETNSLLGDINTAVQGLLKDRIAKGEERKASGLEIQNKLTDINKESPTYIITDEAGIERNISGSDYYANEIIKATSVEQFGKINEEGEDRDYSQLFKFAEKLNVKTTNKSAQQVFADLQYILQDYADLATITDELRYLEKLQTVYAYQGYTEQELLQQTSTDKTAQEVLVARVAQEGAEDYVPILQGTSIGLDPKKLEATESLYEALAISVKKTNKNLQDLNSTLKDSWEAYKNNKEGTTEWYAAVNKLLPALRKVFGENVDYKWIEKYRDELNDLAKGGEEAEKAISSIRADQIEEIKTPELENLLTDLKITEEEWNKLNGSTLEVGATYYGENLEGGLEASKDKLESLANYISSLAGMSAKVQAIYDDGGNIIGYQIATTNLGSGAAFSDKTKSGGGGGGNKEFKNDFDKYYNMVEDINELERLRNLLETDYNQLLESEAVSGKAIYDNLKKQIDLLKERRDITTDLAEKRKQQILDEMAKSENQDLSEYAWWNEEDQTVEINWDKINEIKDSELGDRIKDFVSTLEDFQSQYDDQLEALQDIESELQEIEKRGRDQYTSLEDRVRDALIKQVQDKIDELTASNEGINTANQNLLQSIQDTLDKQRQERDNKKTEKELSDKEQHLAYLRQDSSGANALEIAKLEQELADARESYTDQLIDQKISELQKQNDEAAEQRQEQIDLMQQSLEWQEKNGEFWDQVHELIATGVDEQGQLVHGSELETLLKNAETWSGLSEEGKMNWLSELETSVAEAVGYLYLSRQLEKIGTKEGTEITFTDAEGKVHSGKVDKNGNVVIDNGDGTQTVWKDVYQSYNGTYHTLETEKEAKTEKKPATGTQSYKPQKPQKPQKYKEKEEEEEEEGENGVVYQAIRYYGTGLETAMGKATSTFSQEEANRKAYINAIDSYINRVKDKIDLLSTSFKFLTPEEKQELSNLRKKLKEAEELKKNLGIEFEKYLQSIGSSSGGGGQVMVHYATGGLNTTTGPAWLDGTSSHPELVLNARDTENFIQLKDTLADLKKYGTLLGTNGGDNYYDIDVHVDEISSDYDVDKLADRLKTLIYRDGQYRNVNVLNRLR